MVYTQKQSIRQKIYRQTERYQQYKKAYEREYSQRPEAKARRLELRRAKGIKTLRESKQKEIKYYVDENGCWICTSHCIGTHGYASIKRDGKPTTVPRYFFEKYKHKLELGQVVRHTCDVHACINPDHLLAGTKADNSHDMAVRKRSTYGEKNPMAKLNEQQVIEIFKMEGTYKPIAERYNISEESVCAIKKKIRWKHVVGDL